MSTINPQTLTSSKPKKRPILHKVVVELADGRVQAFNMKTYNGIPAPKPGQTPQDAEQAHVERQIRKSLAEQKLELSQIKGWARVETKDDAAQREQDARELEEAQRIINEGLKQRQVKQQKPAAAEAKAAKDK